MSATNCPMPRENCNARILIFIPHLPKKHTHVNQCQNQCRHYKYCFVVWGRKSFFRRSITELRHTIVPSSILYTRITSRNFSLSFSLLRSYLETGCSVLRLILKSFAPVIKSNMAAPPAAEGCDIVREERFVICQ